MISTAIAQLETLDLAAAGRAEVEAALRQLGRVMAWAEAQRVKCTRRLQVIAQQQPLDPQHLLAGAGRISGREAQQAVRRSEALALVPTMEAALETGRVSASHVDSLARGVSRLGDEQRQEFAQRSRHLATLAAASSPEEFDRCVKQLVAALEPDGGITRFEAQRRNTYLKHWTDRDTGMWCLHGEFDPESGLRLAGRLHRTVERMFHTATPETSPSNGNNNDHLQALALVALVTNPANVSEIGDGTTSTTSATPPHLNSTGHVAEISVLIDLQTLQHGPHDRSIVEAGHGLELSVETIRRIACTAGVLPVVLDGEGVALDVGRTKRLATATQRRALRAMFPTCAVPGCSVRFEHTVPHHLVPWEAGGPTDLANLLPLCSTHHHAVHEGGWQIRWRSRAGSRHLVVQRPGEPESSHAPPRARSA